MTENNNGRPCLSPRAGKDGGREAGGLPGQDALTLFDDLIGLVDEGDNFIEFFVNISRHGELLYSHSLNVALMSLAFSRYLAWPREDAISFGLGGLLHDIGMIRIPREIIEKPVALTPAEETLVHKHPQDGYNFLMSLPNIRKEIMLMTLQHHENGDGSGYPWGLPMKEIHQWGRLLRIIDQLRKRHLRAALARSREPIRGTVANEKRMAADPRL